MKTNNVTRMLDAKKIPYTVFELPNEKLGALETAQYLQIQTNQIYKTIVVQRGSNHKPVLALVDGESAVDLKKLAKALNEKKMVLPTEKEAENITKLQVGGISPLALLNRGFDVILDERAASLEEIHVSAGQRGLNIRLRVSDLIKLTNAFLLPISESSSNQE